MARRTGFREPYYTGTRNYVCAGKIGASNHVKLCVFLNHVFLIFSRFVNSFGLGLGVARDMIIPDQVKSTRPQEKSIWKSFRWDKVILHIIKVKEFWIWRRFRTPNDIPRTHERALTHNGFYTWLEELASESNTIQAQGNIIAPGRLELQTL